MKILVTGATGFVGSHIANTLQKNGHYVIGTGVSTENHPQVNEMLSNHFDGIDYNRLKDLDVVIHQAANNDTRDMDSQEMLKANFKAPLQMFKNLYQLGCRKFVYASSTAIYGNSPAPFTENTKLDPQTPYAESKMLFDLAMPRFIKECPGTTVVGLRYCNVYGPGENHKNQRASMINHMIRNHFNLKPIQLFEFGEQKRDWVYVNDIVQANIKALNYSKEVFDLFVIGSGKAVSFNDLYEMIVNNPKEYPFKYIKNPYGSNYQNHTECDISKAQELLEYEPEYDIKKGIQEYKEYFTSLNKLCPTPF